LLGVTSSQPASWGTWSWRAIASSRRSRHLNAPGRVAFGGRRYPSRGFGTLTMCGFVAFVQEASVVAFDTARRGLDSIAHRGPDAAGEWTEENVFLGHRRLSIIDL